MKRVLLARPDLSVPWPALVAFFLGSLGAGVACVFFLLGHTTMCAILPVLAVGIALVAVFLWSLGGHQISLSLWRWPRRTALVFLVIAASLGQYGVRCRLNPSLIASIAGGDRVCELVGSPPPAWSGVPRPGR